MNKKWNWVLGLPLAMIVFVVPSVLFGFLISDGMASNTIEWSMPMVDGTPLTTVLGTIFLIWLILAVTLILIGLGIEWLVKENSAHRDF